MVVQKSASSPVFLLGAGFNIDTGTEAGSLDARRYPLVSDLTKACFGLDTLPAGQSIEELFQEAIDARNHEPLDKLCHIIMEADFSLTPHLSPGGSRENNVYLRMLKNFQPAAILTFNYDSFVEILLLKLGQWRPEDGYGVPVRAELPPDYVNLPPLPQSSSRPVLHLHGSLCIYPMTTEIEGRPRPQFDLLRLKDKPDFIFDPESIAACFIPFEGVSPVHSFRYPSERVIAPVPRKATGLRDAFIRQVHKQAVEILRSTRTMVVIGYSFNPYDRESYSHLLEAAQNKRVILVVPEAQNLVSRLSKEYPRIEWYAVPATFREWVTQGYEGL